MFYKKNNTWVQAHNLIFFRVGENRTELRHFDKYFVKNTRKKTPQGNILEFFLLGTIKNMIWMENSTQRWMQSRPLSKIRAFFRILKKGQRGLSYSTPFVACLWVWLNMHQYPLNIPKHPWKCMNKLFWLCQGFQYASSSYIFDRVFNCLRY